MSLNVCDLCLNFAGNIKAAAKLVRFANSFSQTTHSPNPTNLQMHAPHMYLRTPITRQHTHTCILHSLRHMLSLARYTTCTEISDTAGTLHNMQVTQHARYTTCTENSDTAGSAHSTPPVHATPPHATPILDLTQSQARHRSSTEQQWGGSSTRSSHEGEGPSGPRQLGSFSSVGVVPSPRCVRS